MTVKPLGQVGLSFAPNLNREMLKPFNDVLVLYSSCSKIVLPAWVNELRCPPSAVLSFRGGNCRIKRGMKNTDLGPGAVRQ